MRFRKKRVNETRELQEKTVLKDAEKGLEKRLGKFVLES